MWLLICACPEIGDAINEPAGGHVTCLTAMCICPICQTEVPHDVAIGTKPMGFREGSRYIGLQVAMCKITKHDHALLEAGIDPLLNAKLGVNTKKEPHGGWYPIGGDIQSNL